MGERIVKKIWPRFFKLMLEGKKNVDVRLADFKLEDGDEILFKEYDPRTKKYTGRSLVRRVKNRVHINFTSFNTMDEIHKLGHWVMELEEVEE